MEEKQIFRKSVMDRLSSPEELNDYLHVTRPSVWIALVAVVVILAGALVWSSVTYINSYVDGTAEVKDGTLAIVLDRETPFVNRLEAGQEIIVGDAVFTVSTIGYRDEGIVVTARCGLMDGTYPAKVKFSKTQLLGMIFN